MIGEAGKKLSKVPVKVPVPVALGVITVVFTAVVFAWAGSSPNAAAKEPASSKVDSTASAAVSPPAVTVPQSAAQKTAANSPVDTAQVKAYLTAGTDYYVQLFQQAQQALGTTQYVDAYAGIAALDDPTSAASMWSAFQQKFMKADYAASMTKAYNQASDAYTAAGVDTPSVVDDWNNDMNQAYSDIGSWMSDATSWQISGSSSAQLNDDAQKFQRAIAIARADIANL